MTKDSLKKCKHCQGDLKIRNPKGFCDHLYYPDYCQICQNTMTKDKTEDWEERFDNIFNSAGLDHVDSFGDEMSPRNRIKNFIKSEIARVKAETRKEIISEIKKVNLEDEIFKIIYHYSVWAYGSIHEFRRNVAKAVIKLVKEKYEEKKSES